MKLIMTSLFTGIKLNLNQLISICPDLELNDHIIDIYDDCDFNKIGLTKDLKIKFIEFLNDLKLNRNIKNLNCYNNKLLDIISTEILEFLDYYNFDSHYIRDKNSYLVGEIKPIDSGEYELDELRDYAKLYEFKNYIDKYDKFSIIQESFNKKVNINIISIITKYAQLDIKSFKIKSYLIIE